LTIPNSVTSIDVGAFSFCSGFTNITLVGYDVEPTWNVGNGIFRR
jgi:hypothetical protein